MALAILILFNKHASNQSSDWYAEATKNGVDHAIDKFCRNMPASPTKLLRTAFSIRALRYYSHNIFTIKYLTVISLSACLSVKLGRNSRVSYKIITFKGHSCLLFKKLHRLRLSFEMNSKIHAAIFNGFR